MYVARIRSFLVFCKAAQYFSDFPQWKGVTCNWSTICIPGSRSIKKIGPLHAVFSSCLSRLSGLSLVQQSLLSFIIWLRYCPAYGAIILYKFSSKRAQIHHEIYYRLTELNYAQCSKEPNITNITACLDLFGGQKEMVPFPFLKFSTNTTALFMSDHSGSPQLQTNKEALNFNLQLYLTHAILTSKTFSEKMQCSLYTNEVN